jgi:DNA-binding LacI/PurR family transcriptional regulator
MKNPDEFYFKMQNAHVVDGKIIELARPTTKDPIELQKSINVVAMKTTIEENVSYLLENKADAANTSRHLCSKGPREPHILCGPP